MEANRENARVARERAEHYMSIGETSAALKFFKMSLRMNPSDLQVERKIQMLEARKVGSSRDSNANEKMHSPENKDRENEHASRDLNGKSSTKLGDHSVTSCSKEQRVAVEKIVDCRELYTILQVSRTAKKADIKKAYRELTLQVHPDKNPHPKAAEAFDKINVTRDILLDDSKRYQYDTELREKAAVYAEYDRLYRQRFPEEAPKRPSIPVPPRRQAPKAPQNHPSINFENLSSRNRPKPEPDVGPVPHVSMNKGAPPGINKIRSAEHFEKTNSSNPPPGVMPRNAATPPPLGVRPPVPSRPTMNEDPSEKTDKPGDPLERTSPSQSYPSPPLYPNISTENQQASGEQSKNLSDSFDDIFFPKTANETRDEDNHIAKREAQIRRDRELAEKLQEVELKGEREGNETNRKTEADPKPKTFARRLSSNGVDLEINVKGSNKETGKSRITMSNEQVRTMAIAEVGSEKLALLKRFEILRVSEDGTPSVASMWLNSTASHLVWQNEDGEDDTNPFTGEAQHCQYKVVSLDEITHLMVDRRKITFVTEHGPPIVIFAMKLHQIDPLVDALDAVLKFFNRHEVVVRSDGSIDVTLY